MPLLSMVGVRVSQPMSRLAHERVQKSSRTNSNGTYVFLPEPRATTQSMVTVREKERQSQATAASKEECDTQRARYDR